VKSSATGRIRCLTYIARSGSADPGEWDNLVPTKLAELPDLPTVPIRIYDTYLTDRLSFRFTLIGVK
jgi:hypothetical protein